MDGRDRQNLVAGILVVALLVAGYWIVTAMHRHKVVEECLLARKRNCDQLLEH